ncbi:hypothetical protein ACVIHI_008842 [Bradyrhizobium sp. USDA 4524]|uniref:amidohydrolase family protein n=1 Tax=unclassified Bradyrhizobium TaxID=2631580 RepID=UPI00209FB5BE|nr:MULTISPECIES: amidohydrolase family protein [unclassified Bradyrhizobium]MCP1845689.1 hypothetical protein [Bradyrhizobium sp. USDA 4538]MCP1906987.1 hypothetical protein [Bradyrhizobium sp. USDA 4537]MCP1985463.1 hypothetical protein [Bradyrhizobium sp. USDA 4539]
MLQELGYASRRYPFFKTDKLIAMAKTKPAKMVRIDAHVGSLDAGRQADVIVVRGDVSSPTLSVVSVMPADVALVVVGGSPIYGDDTLMKLAPLTVYGTKKLVNLAGTYAAGKSLASIEQAVSDALAKQSFAASDRVRLSRLMDADSASATGRAPPMHCSALTPIGRSHRIDTTAAPVRSFE